MSISVLAITISNPILVGVYKDNVLIEKFEKDGKTTDILPQIIQILDRKYSIDKICYVNSPGSFMAIKIAYIMLKSYCIIKNIPLFAQNGFIFNENSPIKALGKKYFKNKNKNIYIDFLNENESIKAFILPDSLDENLFEKYNLPKYHISAV